MAFAFILVTAFLFNDSSEINETNEMDRNDREKKEFDSSIILEKPPFIK